MAQDFERNTANGVGTSAVTLRTANSDDAIVGIMVANVTSSQITVEVYINDSSNDIHLIKDAPIPAGSALQILDGGAKVVIRQAVQMFGFLWWMPLAHRRSYAIYW